MIITEKLLFGGYIGTGAVRPETKSRAGKSCQHILQTPPSMALLLLHSELPTYTNNDLHIFIQIFIIMTLFILFHPSTRYSPDANLGLLPKPAGRSFFRFCCQRCDPVVKSFCSLSMEVTQSFVLNSLLPYWLATFLSLAC